MPGATGCSMCTAGPVVDNATCGCGEGYMNDEGSFIAGSSVRSGQALSKRAYEEHRSCPDCAQDPDKCKQRQKLLSLPAPRVLDKGEQVGYVEFWIPGDGISATVLNQYLKANCGRAACCQRGKKFKGDDGFVVQSKHRLNSGHLQELRELTVKFPRSTRPPSARDVPMKAPPTRKPFTEFTRYMKKGPNRPKDDASQVKGVYFQRSGPLPPDAADRGPRYGPDSTETKDRHVRTTSKPPDDTDDDSDDVAELTTPLRKAEISDPRRNETPSRIPVGPRHSRDNIRTVSMDYDDRTDYRSSQAELRGIGRPHRDSGQHDDQSARQRPQRTTIPLEPHRQSNPDRHGYRNSPGELEGKGRSCHSVYPDDGYREQKNPRRTNVSPEPYHQSFPDRHDYRGHQGDLGAKGRSRHDVDPDDSSRAQKNPQRTTASPGPFQQSKADRGAAPGHESRQGSGVYQAPPSDYGSRSSQRTARQNTAPHQGQDALERTENPSALFPRQSQTSDNSAQRNPSYRRADPTYPPVSREDKPVPQAARGERRIHPSRDPPHVVMATTGIEQDVLTFYLERSVDPQAKVDRVLRDGRPCYEVWTNRPLEKSDYEDIKADSEDWKRERVSSDVRYKDSETARRRAKMAGGGRRWRERST